MSTEIQAYQEQPEFTFNPNNHIMQIKNKSGSADYLPVQWRLVWFREHCPQGTIETEEIVVDLDRECEAEVYAWNQDTKRSEKVLKRAPGYARFRAVVTDGKGGRATGTKTERGVDFPDFVEKAETGAIGRALAALGYGTQFAPELDEEERIVDAPVEKRRKATEQEKQAYQQRKPFVEGTVASIKEEKQADAPATDQQLASIRKLHQHLGKPEFENAEQIGYLQAKAMIETLSKEYRESREKPAQPPQKPLTNGNGSPATVAITRGDLYTSGEQKGLWSRTSPEKFYAWASAVAGRPQSKTTWDMTLDEMGEMAKQIYESLPATVAAAN